MKLYHLILLAALPSGLSPPLQAHLIGDARHDAAALRFAREFAPVQVTLWTPLFAAVAVPVVPATLRARAMFEKFSPAVRLRDDGDFLFVESRGLPAHDMMIGITVWQQQVPLPQPYTGANAWRIPLHPQPSPNPVSIKNRFLRGAIALAANGIPIFNPQNNRGEISAEIGELDQWGGHCGRADDYHYHAAPLHLQSVLGRELPVAVALDGYPIFGLTEPDGSPPENLDAFNGHEAAGLGYHYHASMKYPYVNGGFHGVVVEREEQVDPQPRAQGVRPALPPLSGAKIIGFTMTSDQRSAALRYTVNGREGAVKYFAGAERTWKFQYVGTDGTTREETYQADERRGGAGKKAGGAPKGGNGKISTRQNETRPPDQGRASNPVELTLQRTGNFSLRSPAVAADGVLPAEFTGDGASLSPPLEWSGAPAGTAAYAVIMHHVDPAGLTKWYWTLYNIPADVPGLPKNAQGIGTAGSNSINRLVGYAPPQSKGPGAKTYVVTAYALSAPLAIALTPGNVDRDALLAAMQGFVLDTAELRVTYTRSGEAREAPAGRKTEGRR